MFEPETYNFNFNRNLLKGYPRNENAVGVKRISSTAGVDSYKTVIKTANHNS